MTPIDTTERGSTDRPGPGADRQRVRSGERRRALPARRPEPRRHRPRAGPAAPRDRPDRRPPETCSRLLLEVQQVAAEDFPYDPEYGEPYNSRERFFVERLGDDAGWLHAGRPRREAARIALRLHLRGQLLELVDEAAAFARRHRPTWRPARGHADARPDLPAARPALDVRPLPAVVRLPRAARRPPAARRVRLGSTAAPAAPAASTAPGCSTTGGSIAAAAGLRRGHRAHPRRDVADRRAHPRAGHRAPACCPRRASSPRTWRSGPAASSTSSTWPTPTPGPACSCHRSATPTRCRSCAGPRVC